MFQPGKKKQINWILLKLKMFVLQSTPSNEWKQSTERENIAKHISDGKKKHLVTGVLKNTTQWSWGERQITQF